MPEEYSCPDCEKTLPTEWGLASHHGQVHDGSINTRVKKECEACGENFEVDRRRKSTAKYCSKDCLHGCKIETECVWCGEPLLRTEWRISENERQFCDSECRDKWRSEEFCGEKNPLSEGTTIECEYCGEKDWRSPSYPDTKHNFCSSECHGRFVSENNLTSGENNPNWCGGYDPYYGPNWRSQRRKVLERDNYKCQNCGKSKEELGMNPDVHHRTPFRKFEDYEKANRLENLVCLCKSCHGKV